MGVRGYLIGPCARACSIAQLVLGCITFVIGPVGNGFIPICYVPYTLLTALGALFLVTGVLCMVTCSSQLKQNFLSRAAVCLSLNSACWILSAIYVQIAINVASKSFLVDRNSTVILQEWECPYTKDNTDELALLITGGIAFGMIACYIPLSAITFASFWASTTEPKLTYAELPTIPLRRSEAIPSEGNFNDRPYETVAVESPRTSAMEPTNGNLYGDEQVQRQSAAPVPYRRDYEEVIVGNPAPKSAPVSQPPPPPSVAYNTQAAPSWQQQQQAANEDIYAMPQKPRKAATVSAGTAYNITGEGLRAQSLEVKALRCTDAMRTTVCNCLVDSLASLKPIAIAKLGYRADESLAVYHDHTGEEIATEADFQRVPNHSLLMVCSRHRRQVWQPRSPEAVYQLSPGRHYAGGSANPVAQATPVSPPVVPPKQAQTQSVYAAVEVPRTRPQNAAPVAPAPPGSQQQYASPYGVSANMANGTSSYHYPPHAPSTAHTSPSKYHSAYSSAQTNSAYLNDENNAEFVI